ncbi:hypothetical protein EER27_05630 [Lysobacter psychrotolerans]|uniref:Molecular chaperone n=2 Tax=Montanilutibacter psychrotolerans TaxID=1327343 RepID=A0A3M8SVC4_9GAMM|nr:hypothetical protein EER27_05630 [Lysobacter psychrotolerans]
MLTPGTLVLDGATRSGEITVGNPGEAVATFRVDNAFFVQAPNGQLSARLPETPSNSALELLRVGPRRFALAGGEGQTVRVAARVPRELAPGEYRLHLAVTNLAEQAARAEVVQAKASHSLGVVIPFNVARGVRVLLRHQVVPEGGRLVELTRSREGSNVVLGFDVQRLGVTSLLARVVPFIRGPDGQELKSWPAIGTTIYAEQTHRHFETRVLADELRQGASLCVRLEHSDPGAPQLPAVEACAP